MTGDELSSAEQKEHLINQLADWFKQSRCQKYAQDCYWERRKMYGKDIANEAWKEAFPEEKPK